MNKQTFWKTVKPYFSDKLSNSYWKTLLENDSVLTDDKDIGKIMSNFIISIKKKKIKIKNKTYKDSSLIDINEINLKLWQSYKYKKDKKYPPNILILKRFLGRMLKKKSSISKYKNPQLMSLFSDNVKAICRCISTVLK